MIMTDLPNVVSVTESTSSAVKVHRGGNTHYPWPLCRRSDRRSMAGFYEAAPGYLPVGCKNCLKVSDVR